MPDFGTKLQTRGTSPSGHTFMTQFRGEGTHNLGVTQKDPPWQVISPGNLNKGYSLNLWG